jgi:hypothetical protein
MARPEPNAAAQRALNNRGITFIPEELPVARNEEENNDNSIGLSCLHLHSTCCG